MRKLIVTLLTLCLLLSLAVPALADAETSGELIRPEEKNSDGTVIKEASVIAWSLDGTTLTLRSISGPGEMLDLAAGEYPWAAHKDTITTVNFTGGVTYVGAYAFKDYDKITSVSFDAKTKELGESAFQGCDGLTKLSIPFTGKFFMGKDSLRECKNLKRIDFAGRFPKFESNCLWDTYATLYYPASSPWPADTIAELEKAFSGRIEFRGSDGSDPVTPTEPPKPTDPKPTEKPKPKPTTGNTPTPTETVTEPTWSVPTESVTITRPTFTLPTYVPQDEEEQQDGGGFSGWIAVVVVIGLLAGFAAVTIHVQEAQRRKRRKRRRPRPDFQ